MGDIFIEGMGRVQIKGDVPTEEEAQAILEGIGGPEEEGDIFLNEEGPARPVGIPEPIGAPREGPLGLMRGTTRARVRGAIEQQPGLVQLLIEATPSTAGAVKGGAVGLGVGGVPGMLIGAGVGGLGGEVLAQETGVSPRSDVNLALAAGGPLIGLGVGKGAQAVRRGLGKAFTKAPFARTAFARNMMSTAVEEFESIGTKILAKQKGLMARPTQDLFAAMRRTPVRIPPNLLNKTRGAIAQLEEEIAPLASFPEVQQSLGLLKNIRETILANPEGVLLQDVVRTRSLIGVAVAQAESVTRKAGVRLGSAKRAFASLVDDMDKIATSGAGKTVRQTKLAKAAIARAKLGFSLDEMEGAVARFVKDVPDGQSINITGLQKWLKDVTNPKHAKFNKNFSQALKDELPAIKERLTELAKVAGDIGSAAGPGSIVVRGQTARLGRILVGALLGGGITGNVMGAGVGAVAGASLPEMIVAALQSKTGAAFMSAAARMGEGQINRRAWIVLGQIIARQAAEKTETPGTIEFAVEKMLNEPPRE